MYIIHVDLEVVGYYNITAEQQMMENWPPFVISDVGLNLNDKKQSFFKRMAITNCHKS